VEHVKNVPNLKKCQMIPNFSALIDHKLYVQNTRRDQAQVMSARIVFKARYKTHLITGHVAFTVIHQRLKTMRSLL
jgi:hypothetical protein